MSGTPTGRRGALTGGLWLAASNLIPFAATMVLSVVMGRVLGPDELGIQSFIAYVTTLLTALIVTVITTMSYRVLAQAYGRGDSVSTARLFQWSVIGQVAGSFVVAVVLLVFSARADSWVSWCLAAACVISDGFFWAKASYLVAVRGWASVARSRLLSQTGAAFAGIVAVLAGMGINGVFLANLGASIGLLIWVSPKKRLPQLRPLSPFPRELVGVWRSFMTLGILSQIVNYRIEFLFLGAWSDSAELAMYSVAFMAVSTAVSLPSSVISAAMPAVAAQEGAGRVQEAAASLGAAFRVLIVAAAIITAGVASLGPPLVSLAYGAEFLEAANLIPLLSLGIVASTTAMLFWSFMQGSGRMRIPITASAMAAVVDLGVAFALVGSLGAKGAAIANVCAQYVLFIGIAILSRREFPHFRAGLRVLVAPVAFCVVLGLSCMWLVRTVGYSDAGSAAVALLLGGVVAAAATLGYGSLIGFFRGPDAVWLGASLPAGLGRFLFLVTASRRRPSSAPA